MTEFERLEKSNFIPKFKAGDIVQTKKHITYFRKQTIEEIGNILYLLTNGGVINFRFEDDWELSTNKASK